MYVSQTSKEDISSHGIDLDGFCGHRVETANIWKFHRRQGNGNIAKKVLLTDLWCLQLEQRYVSDVERSGPPRLREDENLSRLC